MKKNKPTTAWTTMMGPEGGSVSSLAIIELEETNLYMGSQIGIFHGISEKNGKVSGWRRLEHAPLGVLCMNSGIRSNGEPVILAGTVDGVYTSHNLGLSWKRARLPLSSSSILSIAVSPDFANDRLVLAGTLEDSMFYSNSGGRRWQSQSFGMLDATVFSIAFSPAFVDDGIVFAGTESGMYYSYNRALAWKPVPFPEESTPVLSMVVSPDYPDNRTIFAGTESHGLYKSNDNGQSWDQVTIDANCINALCLAGKDEIFAGTNNGIFSSSDGGLTWTHQDSLSNVITLTTGDQTQLAGFLEDGAWYRESQVSDPVWQPVEGISIRGFTRLVLSPGFDKDGTAFLASSQDGVWRTTDSGLSWEDLSENFPGGFINQVEFSGDPDATRFLTISSDNGLWLSWDLGETWILLNQSPCSKVSSSMDGNELLAVFPGDGLYRLDLRKVRTGEALHSDDLGGAWRPGNWRPGAWDRIEGPWDQGGVVLALSQQKDGTLHAAHLEGIGETLSIWQGIPGELDRVHSQPAGDNPVVSFWIPADPVRDRPWYASLGETVWRFSARRDGVGAEFPLFKQDIQEPTVSITGAQIDNNLHLFACTGLRVYHSVNEGAWSVVHEFGDERAVDFKLSHDFATDHTAYALLLGGKITYGKLLV